MKEVAFELNGVYHCADCLINGDGTIEIISCVKDNGIDNCDPCEVTATIREIVQFELSEDVNDIVEQTNWERKNRNQLLEKGNYIVI